MDPGYLVLIFFAGFLGFKIYQNSTALKPTEAARLIAAGKAVLIDVREPDEWADGVAGPALLLSLSDLRGSRRQWRRALKTHQGKQLLLYCASGMRSGMAARTLQREGHAAQNLGGFGRWARAGLPTRKPTAPELRP